jgi:hypothetical protein
MERFKQTWGPVVQAQDRKSHRSAVACKDLRTAVYIKIFLIGMLWIANSLVCRGELTGRFWNTNRQSCRSCVVTKLQGVRSESVSIAIIQLIVL